MDAAADPRRRVTLRSRSIDEPLRVARPPRSLELRRVLQPRLRIGHGLSPGEVPRPRLARRIDDRLDVAGGGDDHLALPGEKLTCHVAGHPGRDVIGLPSDDTVVARDFPEVD